MTFVSKTDRANLATGLRQQVRDGVFFLFGAAFVSLLVLALHL